MTATRHAILPDDATLRAGQSARVLPLAAIAILLATSLAEVAFSLDKRMGVGSDAIWVFHVVAVALLAARWRMRGALAGLALSLALLVAVELTFRAEERAAAPHYDAGLALVVLANIVISLTVGWLAERLSRADELRRVTRQSSRQLADAEARYRTLVEQLPVVVYTAHLGDAATLYISPQVEDLLGYSSEMFVARPLRWRELVHPDDHERVYVPVDWGARGDHNALEYRAYHRDGRMLWLSDDYRVVRHSDGQPAFLQGVVQDITTRKAAEAALRLRDRAVAAASDGILITDPRQPGNPVIFANPAFERMTGYTVEEIVGRNLRILQGPDTDPLAVEQIRAAIAERRECTVTLLNYRKDGTQFWNELRVAPVRDTDGALAQFVGVLSDVTERRQAMERLRHAEQRYRSAIELMPAASGVSLCDEHGTTLSVSPQIETLLGYTVDEHMRDPTLWLRTVHPHDRERVRALHAQTNATGEPFIAEYRMLAKNGHVVWVWDHAVLARWEDGREYWQWLKFDITERKQSEAAAREHEARFRAAIEGSYDAFYILQSVRAADGALVDFVYVDANERAGTLLGRRKDELIGQLYSAMLPAGRFEHYFPLFAQALASGVPLEEETTSRYPSGEQLDMHYQAVPFGDGLAITTRDITERKRLEAARLEAEARYRMLVEHVPAVTYIQAVDDHASTIFISPQIEALLGYTPADWLTAPGLWLTLMHPDDRADVLAEHRRTNCTGEPFRMEYRFIARDGAVVWVRDEGVLVRDETAQPLFWQGVFLDITERKRADLALAGQTQVLAALSAGQPLAAVLDTLCRALEAQMPGALCSVLLLDENGRLTHGSAPSLPAGYLHGIDGTLIGPEAGSCGRAAALGVTVITENIATDPRWALYKDLALTHGLRACWSEPIRDGACGVLGTFAVYHHAPCTPLAAEVALIAEASKLAQVVVERSRAAASLREAEQKYRTLVEQMPAVVYIDNIEEPHINLYISPGVQDLLGYADAEWRAEPELWFTLLHPDDEERVRAESDRSGLTREPFVVEYRVFARDGRVVWLRDEARVVYDGAGQPLYWQGVWLDITARMEAEERLRQHSAYVRLLQTVAMAANEAASVEEAMQTTLDQVCQHIGWPIGHVLMPTDDPTEGIVSAGIWHLDHPERFGAFRQITELMGFMPGVGLPGKVLETGRACWLHDVRERSGARTAALAERIGVRSGFACPVLVGAEVVAVLEFFTDVVTRADDALLDVLGQLGAQLGRVIERKRAVEALRQSEERFRSLVQNGRDIVVILNSAGQITYATPSMASLLGHDVTELLGSSPLALIHADDQSTAAELLGGLLHGAQVETPAQVRVRHADGTWRYIEAVGVNLLENPSVRGIVVTARDVTERRQFEAQLEHQAFYDPLTNLPNRALFLNRLDHALELAARGGAAVGVMFLDLDRFKIVNDSLGHAVGDQLLQLLGERIQGCLRTGDTLARLGGDEFIILLEGIRSAAEAVAIAERVIDAFRAPYTLAGQEVSLSTSIGIVVTPQESQPLTPALSGDLMRMADIALNRAKATSRATYAVFDPSMNVFSVERLKLESDLRRAVERGELRLHYQPELDLATGVVVGVEALARWQHPQWGLVPPSEFIPIAEETDLIVSIGQWVLEEALRQVCAWQALGPRWARLTVGVNLSARQFQQPDIVERVAGALRDSGVDPALVRLEITESVVVHDAESTIETLRALKALGVKLAIDDFGTGYSSLSYLTRLTVDTLKVDRSFVSGANSDERSTSIVNAVVALAHSLGMRVTAEGIETELQLARMREVGCDRGQGYLFARPLPPSELEAWLRRDVARRPTGGDEHLRQRESSRASASSGSRHSVSDGAHTPGELVSHVHTTRIDD